jgi:DNA primase
VAGHLEHLKNCIPLLDYLQRLHWTARPTGNPQEFVGLCPLHADTRPSFYVNAHKNLFYCHGCGSGGDLIRFVQLSQNLTFGQSISHLKREIPPPDPAQLIQPTAAFYQLQLHRHPEAVQYLHQRGIRDRLLIQELGIGYAPGGLLRKHLSDSGYPFHRLLESGLIDPQGRDTLFRRIVFPCRQHGRIVNLYGRSIGAAFPHQLLPHSKGGLFQWDSVALFSSVILVEGLLDLAALWQAGFRNTTCAIGTQLTPAQFHQLTDRPRTVYMAFDQDLNLAGQQAAGRLAQRLQHTAVNARIVQLPAGHDPNSYFLDGATAAHFNLCLEQSQQL